MNLLDFGLMICSVFVIWAKCTLQVEINGFPLEVRLYLDLELDGTE